MKQIIIERPKVNQAGGISDLAFHLKCRLEEKGDGAFINPHEGSGWVTEEYHELVEAIHVGRNVQHEALDVAVAALMIYMSEVALVD